MTHCPHLHDLNTMKRIILTSCLIHQTIMLRCSGEILFISVVINAVLALSPNYYCADMSPQRSINIAQLMGMWYGIEIYNHDPDEEIYIRTEPSCPIIHISEDLSMFATTDNPRYRDINYQRNYGDQNQRLYQQNPRYGQEYQTTNNYYNRRYGANVPTIPTDTWLRRQQQHNEERYLRIWWDENGSGTEYRVSYHINSPGFWKSTGPRNGSELEPQYSHFAGTIQVLKAVGSHMVLTFCHQMPERQLKTILLSRETTLEFVEINGVHDLLHRKGLSTKNIKKVCSNNANLINFNSSILLLTIILIHLIN